MNYPKTPLEEIRAWSDEELWDHLCDSHKAWIPLYLENGMNAYQACRSLNMSYKSADDIRKHPYVSEYLRRRFDREVMKPSEVLARLAAIARASPMHLLDDKGQFSLDIARVFALAIKRVFRNEEGAIVDVELHDVVRALEDIAKSLGMFSEKSVVEIQDGDLRTLLAELTGISRDEPGDERDEMGDETPLEDMGDW